MNLFRNKEIKVEDWVIDSVVQYVCSSMFSAQVLDFIEERCVVFDSEEENKFSYTDAHKDFGALIDSQLGDFMTETGIKPNDFVAALALDINAHQGINPRALQDAFNFIEAVDDFLKFKSIMVRTNKDLNLRALEMLERSGMLTPSTQTTSTHSGPLRDSYSPPPPYNYSGEFEEDGLRSMRLVDDEAVESFVRDLSSDPEQFEEAMKEQQLALKHNMGIELRQTHTQETISDPREGDSPKVHSLYPKLDSSSSGIVSMSHSSHKSELASSDQTPILQYNEVSGSIATLGVTTELQDCATDSTLKIEAPLDGDIDKVSGRDMPIYSQEKELTIENTDMQVQQQNNPEIECRSEIESNLEPRNGSRTTATTPAVGTLGERVVEEQSKELVDEAANVVKEETSEDVDNCPAEELTKQWMAYAKDQQQIWKSVRETDSRDQGKPTSEDLAKREEYFRRQRDLLRKQRKQEREQQQKLVPLPPVPLSTPPSSSLPPLMDSEGERRKVEEARKFRKALAARLKKEVVEKSK